MRHNHRTLRLAAKKYFMQESPQKCMKFLFFFIYVGLVGSIIIKKNGYVLLGVVFKITSCNRTTTI